jgi:hypothetical protein
MKYLLLPYCMILLSLSVHISWNSQQTQWMVLRKQWVLIKWLCITHWALAFKIGWSAKMRAKAGERVVVPFSCSSTTFTLMPRLFSTMICVHTLSAAWRSMCAGSTLGVNTCFSSTGFFRHLHRGMGLILSPRTSTPADLMMSSSLYTYTGNTVIESTFTVNFTVRNSHYVWYRKNWSVMGTFQLHDVRTKMFITSKTPTTRHKPVAVQSNPVHTNKTFFWKNFAWILYSVPPLELPAWILMNLLENNWSYKVKCY